MIITCIADLHGNYPQLEEGDLLIIAGDLTARDEEQDYLDFYNWVRSQNYIKKVVIAGNHDSMICKEGTEYMGLEDAGFTYLCDSGTEFEGLKIWGSPWTKTFPGINPKCCAFTCDTEEQLAKKWALIPDDIDILITHGPLAGILDRTLKGNHGGSDSLKLTIWKMENPPKIIIHGHIHEAYGEYLEEGYEGSEYEFNQKIINCSHVNERYQPVNKPIRIIL